ncbi:unnamed protein product [Polarella glacialis]|uniref:Glutaredoxin domain-containing protein n=1 Tax=Polarella glacialis TaxID=89957 RepID=A0A813EVD1_POLGL|nr:unnamed protein product [Polarella glacialis]
MACVAAMLRVPQRIGAQRVFGRTPAPRFCTSSLPVVEKATSLIKDHGCVIFSKSTCPFCALAKTAIQDDLGAKCHVLELDRDLDFKDMDTLQNHFLSTTGARSVPRVFIGGKFVGGGSEVSELHSSGQLKGMLEKVGAL